MSVVLLASAVAVLLAPVPTRTLSYTDSDFTLHDGCRSACAYGCRSTLPFVASAGEVVRTDFHYYYVWNDTVVGSYNGTAWIATFFEAEVTGCHSVALSNGVTSIGADGPYAVMAPATTRFVTVDNVAVNATVILDGLVTLTRPGAYLLPLIVFAAAGGILLVGTLIITGRGRPPA